MPIIALVTGANRGLGLAFTRQLIRRGDRVVATARDPDAVEAWADLDETGRLHRVALDLDDPKSIAGLQAAVAAVTDRLDLLINNAGVNSRSVPRGEPNVKLGALEPEGILAMTRINAVGPLLVTQALVDLLARGEAPRVLCISSWLGSVERKAKGGNYGYCISKAALNMATRALAFDLEPRGIIAVAANPGWVQTDMGGESADLTPEQSAAGLLNMAADLTEDDAGRFLQWNGEPHPW